MSLSVLLLLASASAYELPAVLSRRALARAVAAVPLGVAVAAHADASNGYMNQVGKPGVGAGQVDKYGAATKSIGREAVVDEAGAAVPTDSSPAGMPSTAKFTAKEASQDTAGYSAIVRISGTYLDSEGAKIKVQTIGTSKLLVTDLSSTAPKDQVRPSGLVLARGVYDGRSVEIGGLSGTDDGLKGTAVLTGIVFNDGTVWKKL